jgi:hypothetical protein
MTKGKPKYGTIISPRVLVTGSTIVRVEPEDFVELVTTEDVKIIHTVREHRHRVKRGVFESAEVNVYVAPGPSITYYTVSKEKLVEIHIDIFTENLYVRGVTWLIREST